MSLRTLNEEVIACKKCPRLCAWTAHVATEKRQAYTDEEYWGRPVPSFGDTNVRVLVVGLAPGAHGANRTGRMFTGDRSGDWLYRALHRAGYASQPESVSRHDGLELIGAYVSAVVRCAPPANKPNSQERDQCLPYLVRELELCLECHVIVALGGFAWDGVLRALRERGMSAKPKPRFGHGAEVKVGAYHLLGSYHPSQQNTFTGRLTEPMLDAVFSRARELSSQWGLNA